MRVKETTNRPASASVRNLIARMVRGRSPSTLVTRRQIPYWQLRGWSRTGNTYSGNYQTNRAAFVGHIIEHAGGHIDFHLYAPSAQIRNHSHWACFMSRGDGWYAVHMGKRPRDVSSGIITIERLISEAYGS